MKILVVCGHGLGTSLMMEMSIKSILKELAVTAEVDHRNLASAGSETAESLSPPATSPSSYRAWASTAVWWLSTTWSTRPR